jgi:hypothetical protein
MIMLVHLSEYARRCGIVTNLPGAVNIADLPSGAASSWVGGASVGGRSAVSRVRLVSLSWDGDNGGGQGSDESKNGLHF